MDAAGAGTILVLEPDGELRGYLRRCLAALPGPSPDVVEAGTCEEAKLHLGARRFDLVVACLDGPGGDATTLCTALAVGRRGQTPVLLIATGVSSSLESRRFRELEAATLLWGTPSAGILCRAVTETLAESRRQGKDP